MTAAFFVLTMGPGMSMGEIERVANVTLKPLIESRERRRILSLEAAATELQSTIPALSHIDQNEPRVRMREYQRQKQRELEKNKKRRERERKRERDRSRKGRRDHGGDEELESSIVDREKELSRTRNRRRRERERQRARDREAADDSSTVALATPNSSSVFGDDAVPFSPAKATAVSRARAAKSALEASEKLWAQDIRAYKKAVSIADTEAAAAPAGATAGAALERGEIRDSAGAGSGGSGGGGGSDDDDGDRFVPAPPPEERPFAAETAKTVFHVPPSVLRARAAARARGEAEAAPSRLAGLFEVTAVPELGGPASTSSPPSFADEVGEVLHEGENCHHHLRCGGKVSFKDGPCPAFCGGAGACCRVGWGLDLVACRHGKAGHPGSHVCVRAAKIWPSE